MEQEENVGLFIDAIAHAADERRAEIKREIDDYIKTEVEKAENEIVKEYESILAKKISLIKQDINKEISRSLTEKRIRLFERREELMDEIFEAVKEKIHAFKASGEYITFLNRSLEEAEKICGDGMKIYMMERDKDLIDFKYEVIIDENIKLGGLKFENSSGTFFIDDTLDTRLISEKSWFKMYCGLVIT